MIEQFGIWEVCWDLQHYCLETGNVLHFDLKDVTHKNTDWLFLVQFLAVMGSISLGYGNIVILRRIVNFGGVGLRYFYVFTVCYVIFYIAALMLFSLYSIHLFRWENFQWGRSFIISGLSTLSVLVLLLIIGLIKLIIKRKSSRKTYKLSIRNSFLIRSENDFTEIPE